ncbi:unnamed protein product [Thelazia callipaeda]|uniref:Ribonucleases P/MRP protein subunit POP1 n=1 Tax=Thelazia callipaeda TaxID=103827 RepID=A0A0N5CJK2_THECL|nr:unnamed protein product [Thelazia callipaeda]
MEEDEGDLLNRPCRLDVMSFVKERVRQIAELIQAIDNRALVSGEVTKGPRTAAQCLPRHMRRRAMSYNVKRFPRTQRRFAKAVIAASKHRQKPPSRFWRRRPRNLLLNYVRRQRMYVWLETHIWHAKRFRMIKKWGYNLALRSYQRAFRPSYRDSMRHCVAQDSSFLRCFQIIGPNLMAIAKPLCVMCSPDIGPTLASKIALNGHFELSVMLYEPGKYPSGFIAPVRLLWSKHRTREEFTLAVWTHPSSSQVILTKFICLLQLKKQEQKVDANTVSILPKTFDEWRLHNMEIKTDIYFSEDGLKLYDLSDQLIRFRLHGPKSLQILHSVLAVVDDKDCEDLSMSEFISCNQSWKDDWGLRNPGEFPDGTVFSLLVEDPRLTRPSRKTKLKEAGLFSAKSVDISDLQLPLSYFWNLEIRRKALEKKIVEADLQKMRSLQLQTVRTSDAKIPVLVVIRNTIGGTTSPYIGLDLIAPSGFGSEFWIALQYGTARSVGLRDKKFMELESKRFNFPSDVPDCGAGLNEFKEEYISLQEKYLRRPHNRRIKYWNDLSIKYPFNFNFSELSHDWLQHSSSLEATYVVRSRQILGIIDKWLNGKGPAPEEAIMNSAALIPVCLFSFTTGRPQRFALICAPVNEDLDEMMRLTKHKKALEIVETPRTSNISKSVVAENGKKTEAADFISLDVTPNEKVVSLDSLFPDIQMSSRKRKLKDKKKMKRKKAKLAKKLEMKLDGEQKAVISEQVMVSKGDEGVKSVRYSMSCSRLIVGRVVRGDFSFVHGKGFATGYCCLSALKNIRCGIVLFRNVTSKYYHPARITIVKNHLDL